MPNPRLATQVNAARSADALLLEATLDSMPYGFSIWDGDERLVLWNRRYAEIYGLPADRLTCGMPLAAICEVTVAAGNHPGTSPAELYAEYRKRLRESASATTAVVFEKRIRDRAIKTTYTHAPRLGCVVTHEDVTEQALRERDLQTQNLRFDAALNSMAHGFCIFDREFRLVLWNRQFAEMYGLGEEVAGSGLSLADFIMAGIEIGHFPGQIASEMSRCYRRELAALEEDATFVSEEVLSSGRSVKVSYRRMPDLSFVATHEDITVERDHLNALRQRESELAHQNMRFAAAVENMSQGLCMFDRDQKLIICNSRYADLYRLPHGLVKPGTSLQEILRNRIERGIHPTTGVAAYVQRRLDMVTERKHTTDLVELSDGRVIAILHHPMSDGGWVSTHQDITEERRNEARIRHLARHDALTDLPNRIYFRERMEAAEGRIRRGEQMAVLWIDLDHFKGVNDLFGHAPGDALLCATAERLRRSCRGDDIVARLGGDEFAVLHGPVGEAKDLAVLADRIVRALAEPFDVHDHHILIGGSIGIAVAPGDGRDAETLMKNADLALYRAKAEGGGTFHFFEPGMDAALQERLALEIDLRAALAKGELSLVYQPLFNLKDNVICAMEALLRWNHPGRGIVMPQEIIPIAEDTGLIVAIGEWVLSEACAAAMGWPAHVNVAVNLSPVQFKNRHLVEHVAAALAATGLKPERLELEITESVLLAENEPTLRKLHELRNLGVRISMDDFGTGYSSLSYLRSFPFDKIKIDQSFVQDLSRRGDSLAIVKAVIGLGQSLGMTTTAEGVETEDQLDIVRQQGCSEVQGYLFSPPLPASAAALLLRGDKPLRGTAGFAAAS